MKVAAEQPYATKRFGLRFRDRQLERDFQLWNAKEIRTLIRFGMATAVLMWVVAWWVVRLIVPKEQLVGELLIFCIAIPGASAAAALTYPKIVLRWLPLITAGVNCSIGIIVAAVGLAEFQLPVLTVGAMIVLSLYALAIYRLPFQMAAISSLTYMAITQFLLLEDPSMRSNDLVVLSFLLWVSEFGGLSASYVSELTARNSFTNKLTIERQQAELAAERAKSERLLLNVLPASVAEQLKNEEATVAQHFAEVTILFSDVVGFTPLAGSVSAPELVELLNKLFSRFDEIAERNGLEKIKTIGDAYMAAAGVPTPDKTHAEAAANAALEMLTAVDALNRELGTALQIRIGLNTGPVVAGVIGKKKFAYDLWGDSVNTAARMESHGVAGEIQVTEATYLLLRDHFELEPRGEVEIKGKGRMRTWLLRSRAPTAPRTSAAEVVVARG